MPQFGGRHVGLPLGSHYSSWVSRRDDRAPLVSVCGGWVLVVSVGDENKCVSKRISKVRCEYYYRVKWFSTYVWVLAKCFHLPQTQPESVPHKQTPWEHGYTDEKPTRSSDYQAEALHAYHQTAAYPPHTGGFIPPLRRRTHPLDHPCT